MQEIVEKQQQSFQEDAKRVQETVAKQQQQSLQEDAEGVQETVAKSHSVSSSLLAWQECAQEKLADDASSQQLVLARMSAKVESPTCVTLGTVSFAGLCQDVKQ